MCYLWPGIWGRRDYLGSDIFIMSLSKPFFGYQAFPQNWTADHLGSLKKLV